MDKEAVFWALHWPKEEVPDDVLTRFLDLQQVDKQIKQIEHSISLEGDVAYLEGKQFNITDFPMDDRIAQREFVRKAELIPKCVEDVKIGRNTWEVFHALEITVIGIFKRLRDVLPKKHNTYFDYLYRNLQEGDIVEYRGKEVTVAWNIGAHLMKYYREDGELKAIFPSGFVRKIRSAQPIETKKNTQAESAFIFNGNQLEMVF